VSGAHLIMRYASFAVLPTLAHLLTQRLVLGVFEQGQGFALAVVRERPSACF
jgi:hypothetical protein